MREIPLSQGMVALIDDEDYDCVMKVGKWYAAADRRTFYARKNFCRNKVWTSIQMHRLITGWDYVDHINGDGLDNRRVNLRPANNALNSRNRRLRSSNITGFKGITRKGNRWMSSISVDGQYHYLGIYATPEKAAQAYDAGALIHHGEFARLNFPREEN